MQALTELQHNQPHAVPVLAAALRSQRLHHAYLFTSRDVGSARNLMQSFAASLVCAQRQGVDACGVCVACRKLAEGNHPDVIRLLPNDKGVIPIDAVREVTARLSLKASEAPTKVVLVERAERMNEAAQNALLKTLEEPAGPTCFLIATSRIKALAITIRSRCQHIRLATRAESTAVAELRAAHPDLDEKLARIAAALASGDTESAQATLEGGLAELDQRLSEATGDTSMRGAIAAAADLGSEREKADLALALLEIAVRDGLAKAHGAGDNHVLGKPLDVPSRRLAKAAAVLTELRSMQNLYVNRTLALESVLLALRGDVRGQAS
ncbi:MAG: ATP-binding protein [Myxococcota bacterium]